MKLIRTERAEHDVRTASGARYILEHYLHKEGQYRDFNPRQTSLRDYTFRPNAKVTGTRASTVRIVLWSSWTLPSAQHLMVHCRGSGLAVGN